MAIKPFYVPPDGELLFSEAAEYLPLDDVEQLRVALAFATTHHAGQMRKTGEPYISHPLTVAYYMAQHRMDTVALIAALLHDVAEDTLVSLPEIEARFSKSVSDLVKGVTKFEQKADDIARDGLYTKEQVNERTIFGLLGAMKDDIRGLIIKLFDRLHNLETMGIMSPKSRKRKTYEVFNIYAPLANRFGMWSIKSKLERMSFALENPRMFERVEAQMVQLRRVQEPLFRQVKVDLGRKLQQMGVDVKEIFFTPRNIYNVYQEMQQRGHGNRWFGRELRMVVVVNEKDACYQALGAAHTLYKPVHGKFDDYIALPRDNLYRSLHTTIVHSGGKKVKIRFRTPAMDILSRHGVMSLWLGPHTEGWSEEMAADVNKQIAALLVNIGKNIDDGSEAGVQPFINQFFGPQIGVHTPKGDIIELSVNATPIDFAYRIHTDVGHGCRSAVVNGIPVPLNTRLKNGDQVEIHKVDYGSPQRIWLDEDLEFVHMSSHRSEIRRWFRKLPDNKTVHEGKEILETELAMLGLAEIPHANVAGWLGYNSAESIYFALGHAELLSTKLAARILTLHWKTGEMRRVGQTVTTADGEKFLILYAGGRKLRLCRHCRPQPDETIIGRLRKDKHITIHREDCHTLPPDPLNYKTLGLQWGQESLELRSVKVIISVYDRANLIYEIANLMREEAVNIEWMDTPRTGHQRDINLGLAVPGPRQMVRLLHRILALISVHGVRLDLGDVGKPRISAYSPE